MPVKKATRKTIEAIESHPFRWETIPRESVLSLPTIGKRNNDSGLDFFWYRAGGPITKRVIGAPQWYVTAGKSPSDAISFKAIELSELGIEVPTDKPLGDQRDRKLGNVTFDDYEKLLTEFYSTVDTLLDSYKKQITTRLELDAVKTYRAIFDLLVERPLLPFYLALNPPFFRWIDNVSS